MVIKARLIAAGLLIGGGLAFAGLIAASALWPKAASLVLGGLIVAAACVFGRSVLTEAVSEWLEAREARKTHEGRMAHAEAIMRLRDTR